MITITKSVNVGEIDVDIDVDLSDFDIKDLEEEIKIRYEENKSLVVQSKVMKKILERVEQCVLTVKDEYDINYLLDTLENQNVINK